MLLHYQAEEENLLLLLSLKNEGCRKKELPMFKNRQTEGFQSILIKNHLNDNETKFKEFFRISRFQFNYILNLIQDDIKLKPCNRVRDPITPSEKLAVTLRYVYT